VNQYLKTIAQAYDVPWEEQVIEPVVIEPIVQPETLSFSAPVKVQEPSAPQIVDKEPDFDHLSKRFEILKQKK
jgi:hypothetical protein